MEIMCNNIIIYIILIVKQIKPSLSVTFPFYAHCFDLNKFTDKLENFQLTQSASNMNWTSNAADLFRKPLHIFLSSEFYNNSKEARQL